MVRFSALSMLATPSAASIGLELHSIPRQQRSTVRRITPRLQSRASAKHMYKPCTRKLKEQADEDQYGKGKPQRVDAARQRAAVLYWARVAPPVGVERRPQELRRPFRKRLPR